MRRRVAREEHRAHVEVHKRVVELSLKEAALHEVQIVVAFHRPQAAVDSRRPRPP